MSSVKSHMSRLGSDPSAPTETWSPINPAPGIKSYSVCFRTGESVGEVFPAYVD